MISGSDSVPTDMKKVERIYDWLSPIYGFWGYIFESRARRRALEVAGPRPGESVLEVAIGRGELFAALQRTRGLNRCIGIELSAGMLRAARRRLGPSATLVRADARLLPFPDETFDAVMNCYLLDLLSEADIHLTLAEFYRVLKPDGRLVLLTMVAPAWPLNSIWMWLFRHIPLLVGACRPLSITPLLVNSGWKVDSAEQVSQNSFRSQLILARHAYSGKNLERAQCI